MSSPQWKKQEFLFFVKVQDSKNKREFLNLLLPTAKVLILLAKFWGSEDILAGPQSLKAVLEGWDGWGGEGADQSSMPDEVLTKTEVQCCAHVHLCVCAMGRACHLPPVLSSISPSLA